MEKDLTIDGSGQAVKISGGGNVGVFEVGFGGELTLKQLTITDGLGSNFANLTNNGGLLTVIDSTISAGGIGIFNGAGTTTTIRSTISGNGTGIQAHVGTVNVTNSTITNNHWLSEGAGGIQIHTLAEVTVRHSTIANNSSSCSSPGACPSGGQYVGGIYNYVGTLTLQDTVLSGNLSDSFFGGGVPGNCLLGTSFQFNDGGGNLSDDDTCGFSGTTSLNSVSTLNLGSLAYNGGPTQTISLGAGSAAINFAGCDPLIAIDQRGMPRPGGGGQGCDSGAYEVQDPSPSEATTLEEVSGSGPFGGSATLSATLTADGAGVEGMAIDFTLNGAAVGSASTDSSGVASLSNVSLAGIGAGTYPDAVEASFAGDASYAGSSGSGPLTVSSVAPVVDAPSVDIEPSNEGQSVVASASFSGSGTTCTVDYGDGGGPKAGTVGGSTCTGPGHTYLDDALSGTASDEYTVTIEVSDSSGESGSNSAVHVVNNLDPTITEVSNDGPIDEGSSATITVTASDPAGVFDPLQYEFDCGNDGAYEIGPQAGSSAQCDFASDGSHTVGVRVSDDDGGSATGLTVVTVTDVPPAVDVPTVDIEPSDEGQSVVARASFSGPVTSCTVDYGDGGGPEAGTIAGSTCTGPSHTYLDDASSGTGSAPYTVTVEVSDSIGDSGSNSVIHMVNNVAPTITSASNSGPTEEGESATITVAATDPAEILDPIQYEFDCDNDGSYEIGPQAGNSASCSFGDDGSYTVGVRVSDDDGGSETGSTTVTVNNVDPTISGVSNDGPIDEGSPATVTVTATDPAGPNDPLMYEFDCDNDGSYEIGPQAGNSAGCSFGDNGSYTVGVRVSDGDGGSATSSTIVSVLNVAPSVDAPSVDIEPSDEGQSVVASATFTDPGTLDSHSCTVDYGDGSGPQEGAVSGGLCTGLAHVYLDDPSGTASDDYTVTIEVTDDSGESGEASAAHTVNNVAPVITAITTNGPVQQGMPAVITVVATDVGINDVLSYLFDCDSDGIYETAGVGNQGSCTLDPAAATTVIGVQVSDDDLGVSTDSVEVEQITTLCANGMTGAVNGAGPGGNCQAGSIPLTLPMASPLTLCINFYNGALSWSPVGSCGASERPHVVPEDGPLYYCESIWTGQLRVPPMPGQCGSHEMVGVIPG